MAQFIGLVFESEDGVKKVLQAMNVFIEQEGSVSLQTLYDLVGFPSIFSDCKIWWTSMEGVKVVLEDDGFVLDLPDPQKFS